MTTSQTNKPVPPVSPALPKAPKRPSSPIAPIQPAVTDDEDDAKTAVEKQPSKTDEASLSLQDSLDADDITDEHDSPHMPDGANEADDANDADSEETPEGAESADTQEIPVGAENADSNEAPDDADNAEEETLDDADDAEEEILDDPESTDTQETPEDFDDYGWPKPSVERAKPGERIGIARSHLPQQPQQPLAFLIAAIAINGIVFALEIVAGVSGFLQRGTVNLMYYTSLSNLFGGIACAICLAGEANILINGGGVVPLWMRRVKFAAACCLLMTLFVVTLVLAPTYNMAGQNGYYLMFCVRELPITHLIAPLLVFMSYVLFEAERGMTFKQSLVGFLPTLAYAAVAYPCNIARVWEGPYPFFLVWTMPVWQAILWFAVLCVLAIGLCQVVRLVAHLAWRWR